MSLSQPQIDSLLAASEGRTVVFDGMDLTGASFRNRHIGNCSFRDCILRACDFRGADFGDMPKPGGGGGGHFSPAHGRTIGGDAAAATQPTYRTIAARFRGADVSRADFSDVRGYATDKLQTEFRLAGVRIDDDAPATFTDAEAKREAQRQAWENGGRDEFARDTVDANRNRPPARESMEDRNKRLLAQRDADPAQQQEQREAAMLREIKLNAEMDRRRREGKKVRAKLDREIAKIKASGNPPAYLSKLF
jgi:hypothetical protein